MLRDMTAVDFDALRAALERRLEVVADRDFYARDLAGHLAALQAASADVDRLAAALPVDADPRLRHFLERQSYVKAVDWLKNPGAQHG
jgi:hypothetical protein